MNRQEHISAISQLGAYILKRPNPLMAVIHKSIVDNKWFNEQNYLLALDQIVSQYFDDQKLNQWANKYPIVQESKNVGLILAGNIPMVGMHDVLSVIISGHKAIVKCSSKDSHVLPHLIEVLYEINPLISDHIQVVGKLQNYDAILATGSDSTKGLFANYFKTYPKILRGHRNGIAILNGNESDKDVQLLGSDVFTYYGLGCRNVSKLMVPQNFDFKIIADNWSSFKRITDNYKYKNNYDYNLATFTLNLEKHINLEYLLLKENKSLHSRLATIHFEYYSSEDELKTILNRDRKYIQCVISNQSYKEFRHVPFGQSQCPALDDYADGIDTMHFLTASI